jgi:hypothetical protein
MPRLHPLTVILWTLPPFERLPKTSISNSRMVSTSYVTMQASWQMRTKRQKMVGSVNPRCKEVLRQ